MLLDRPDGLYTFRLHRERVYYSRFYNDLKKEESKISSVFF